MSKRVRAAGLAVLVVLLLAIFATAILVDPAKMRNDEFAQIASLYSTDPAKLKPLTLASRVKAAAVGGNVVASAEGSTMLIQQKAIPVDTSKTYRITARFRVTKNDPAVKGSRIFVGVATYDANNKLLTSGIGAHRYAASLGKIYQAGDWIEVGGTISGEGDEKHNQFRPGTASVRPVALLNYQSTIATAQLEWMRIEEVQQ